MATQRIILNRIEGSKAFFITQEGQHMVWHTEDLPENLQIGETYFVTFSTKEQHPYTSFAPKTEVQEPTSITTPQTTNKTPEDEKTSDTSETQSLAKAILEELLNGET